VWIAKFFIAFHNADGISCFHQMEHAAMRYIYNTHTLQQLLSQLICS
jgi:hypothetical protein